MLKILPCILGNKHKFEKCSKLDRYYLIDKHYKVFKFKICY